MISKSTYVHILLCRFLDASLTNPAVFATHNAPSTLGDCLTPFFIDQGTWPILACRSQQCLSTMPVASHRLSMRCGCA